MNVNSIKQVKHKVLAVSHPPLHGVIGDPVDANEDWCFVILNAGNIHHVGPCDLSARLCRQIEQMGVMSVRFDFSGVGDSPARDIDTSVPWHVHMAAQVGDVIDHIENVYGKSKFIVGGLCGGSDGAFAAAELDERVCALFQFDPYVYRNWKWYPTHYAPRLVSWNSWRNLLTGNRNSTRERLANEYLERGGDDGRLIRPRDQVAEVYRQLVARRVPINVVLTRGQLDYLNYPGQFRDVFKDVDFGDYLDEIFLSDTRHIISEPEDQRLVLERMVNWIAPLTQTD